MIIEEMRALLILLLLSCLILGQTLDVSFIPSDTDNPSIPLSTNYRIQLRKLCELIATGKTLPKELESKKTTLQKMCKKLAADDENIAIGTQKPWFMKYFERISGKWLVVGLGAIGGSLLVWKYQYAIVAVARRVFGDKKSKELGGYQDRIAEQDEIRRARLKKLAGEKGGATLNDQQYSDYDFSNANPDKLL